MRRFTRLLPTRKIYRFLDKRQRFAVQTVILTAGILITQLIWEEYRFAMVGILAFASYILTAWSLIEDIRGIEWVFLFILPTLFTSSVSLFYFLLPGRWITRLSITILFAVGTYAILLVENIYNVAAQRSIQLLRAARSVGLLLTLAVVFLTANIVYSLRMSPWLNGLIVCVISFLLTYQSLWTTSLEQKISKQLIIYSVVIALGIGELALALSFWPISNASFSLVIAAGYYATVGLVQQYLFERMFRATVREHVFVFLFTLVLTVITTRWG